ncbi:hypothetical protein B7P43_G04378 [Cryptotermes secundus]|uniref:Uncharacterized protein n=1 Tax=Cryptotermes secundus TaxID=105785 RepID=A0A2J7QC80_9NEOP|nr:hypothetical protein B7P43_G04378 [Cryptotermes secundus]
MSSPLLRNGFINNFLQQRSPDATMEELLETVFPVRSVTKLGRILIDFAPLDIQVSDTVQVLENIMQENDYQATGLIDHILIDRRRHSMSKQTTHRVHMERFNLKKLNEVEGKEQYCVEISNRFTALEILETELDVNRVWEAIRENVKMSAKESLGYCELKKHKPWFDEGCSKLLDQRKQAKLQWLHEPSELNGDNLKNIRRETGKG